jgi:hypothetical protein
VAEAFVQLLEHGLAPRGPAEQRVAKRSSRPGGGRAKP